MTTRILVTDVGAQILVTQINKTTKAHNATQSPTNAEALWDVDDIAAHLKASRSWVYQRATAGLLPYVKIGGLLRFVPSTIRRWVLGPDAA